MRNILYVRIGESKEALVDRFKARVASFLVVSALTTVFLAGSPARAADACDPLPEAVCNSENWVKECVVWIVKYGHAADHCDS